MKTIPRTNKRMDKASVENPINQRNASIEENAINATQSVKNPRDTIIDDALFAPSRDPDIAHLI